MEVQIVFKKYLWDLYLLVTMGEQSNNKGKMISVRIDGQNAEVINASAEHYGLSRSELIRQAAAAYVSLTIDNPDHPNPKLFFSHNMLKILFDAVDEPTIKKVAEQSFLNGKRDYHFFKKLTTGKDPRESDDFSKEDYTTSMIENVFSKNGQNWFEKTKYTHKGNTISFSGKHDMGPNFTIFIRELLSYYMNEINFVLKNSQQRKILPKNKIEQDFNYIRFDFAEKQ